MGSEKQGCTHGYDIFRGEVWGFGNNPGWHVVRRRAVWVWTGQSAQLGFRSQPGFPLHCWVEVMAAEIQYLYSSQQLKICMDSD